MIASGKEKGPVIWVHGCIHGEEYGGAASIIRLYHDLDVDKLKGTFIGVPVVNLPSFKDRSRISPLDGVNLNRAFPGDRDGTYSQQLANYILTMIETHADYVIDLHSGGIGAEVPFYMIVKDGENEYLRYTLSVKGDLTGEGSVNTNDVKVISKYLMKSQDISDIQYISADVNEDGILNGIDILKIAKNNV